MIIEIPGCKFRIRGEEKQWIVEYPNKGKDSGFEGRYFFPQLSFAMLKAYELALRDSKEIVEFKDAPEACKKVSDRLLKAVKKAVSE